MSINLNIGYLDNHMDVSYIKEGIPYRTTIECEINEEENYVILRTHEKHTNEVYAHKFDKEYIEKNLSDSFDEIHKFFRTFILEEFINKVYKTNIKDDDYFSKFTLTDFSKYIAKKVVFNILKREDIYRDYIKEIESVVY